MHVCVCDDDILTHRLQGSFTLLEPTIATTNNAFPLLCACASSSVLTLNSIYATVTVIRTSSTPTRPSLSGTDTVTHRLPQTPWTPSTVVRPSCTSSVPAHRRRRPTAATIRCAISIIRCDRASTPSNWTSAARRTSSRSPIGASKSSSSCSSTSSRPRRRPHRPNGAFSSCVAIRRATATARHRHHCRWPPAKPKVRPPPPPRRHPRRRPHRTAAYWWPHCMRPPLMRSCSDTPGPIRLPPPRRR